MRRYLLYTLLLLLVACDDGPVEENTYVQEEGRTCVLEGNISGVENWSDGYNIALAGFDDESDYAIILKNLPRQTRGHVTLQMAGIPDQVTQLELCVLNRIHQRVYTLASASAEDMQQTDTIRFNVDAVNTSMFNTIQQALFSPTCANCHGAGNRIAAGVDLTTGHSYQSLTNHPSIKLQGMQLVEPGDSLHSVLHLALATDVSITDHWAINHLDQISNETQRILHVIDDWIQGGAEE